ncbi:MAG: glycoside hydrolase family 57 protein [Bacteroidota bacterium]
MTSVCFYFQVHQPVRLKSFSFFQIGTDHQYEAVDVNFGILNRVADKCYLPANNKILELIEKTGGKFKASFSITGTVLEQLEAFRPDVIASFKALADTGCVEFMAETYYHSLAYLFSAEEFERQVKMHTDKVKKLFGVTPTTFRNTELVYSNKVAATVKKMGYKAILAEGVDRNLGGLPPTTVFRAEGTPLMKVLLRHYRLSDDIAFRFSDKGWSEYPLLAPRFANWLHNMKEEGADTINLFLDYETFGEHRAAETGIFQFLTYLPAEVLKDPDFDFATPSEIVAKYPHEHLYNCPEVTTWADEERDLTGWLDNNMQKDAITKIYALEKKVKADGTPELADTWAKLQTSDHFYYMSTKYWEDGVRQAFSPYKSPYDAYINYMNVLSDFEALVEEISAVVPKTPGAIAAMSKPAETGEAAAPAAEAPVKKAKAPSKAKAEEASNTPAPKAEPAKKAPAKKAAK